MRTASRTSIRLLGWGGALGLVLAALLMLSITAHLENSAELVRLRNALLLQSAPADPDWAPPAVPAGFRVESVTPNPLYQRVIETRGLVSGDGDWSTALTIGRHLLQWEGRRTGGPIQSDLDNTYRRITERGEGYCGDFADVFTGLASAAGLFSRAWAFSFDGFGGHGHIFNEIWDRQRQRWVMIDVFHNYYFVGPGGEPLAATEFRDAMLAGGEGLSLVLIEPTARPGYVHEDRAWDYYRRGLPEWYLWMGNNVFEYDRSTLVRLFGRVHRATEQLGGIAARVHPEIRILETETNLAAREAMRWLRVRLLLLVAIGPVSALALLCWLALVLRSRRPRPVDA